MSLLAGRKKAAGLERRVCAFPPCLLCSLRKYLPQDPVVDSRQEDSGLALHQPDQEKKSECGLLITDYLREGHAHGCRDSLQPVDRSEGRVPAGNEAGDGAGRADQ